MKEVLRQGSAPEAVFAHNDLMAIGSLQAIREAGLSCPEDIAVVGYDDSDWCHFSTPKLTTVRHTGWDLGMRVGELLLSELEKPSKEPEHLVLDTALVVRESAAPLSAS